jgi:hypothetical protein
VLDRQNPLASEQGEADFHVRQDYLLDETPYRRLSLNVGTAHDPITFG